MRQTGAITAREGMVEEITGFVKKSAGLHCGLLSETIEISQKQDGETLSVNLSSMAEVLLRSDSESKTFIQINFRDNKKLLLTDSLVGFKPAHIEGLDITKLPRVVTTPDLSNVLNAIQDTLIGEKGGNGELAMLKKIFASILMGAEAVGFKLPKLREAYQRISGSPSSDIS